MFREAVLLGEEAGAEEAAVQAAGAFMTLFHPQLFPNAADHMLLLKETHQQLPD
jgi:hypothetical protein